MAMPRTEMPVLELPVTNGVAHIPLAESITGTVLEPSGASVPEAGVLHGAAAVLRADTWDTFRFCAVAMGAFSVEVPREGFHCSRTSLPGCVEDELKMMRNAADDGSIADALQAGACKCEMAVENQEACGPPS